MKNKLFGLDIGQTMIKAVSLAQENEGYILNAVLSTPTPTNGMLSESPLDQQEIATVIRKMIDDAKIDAKEVSIALPENQVYTKVIDMPPLSDKELSSAIYWEAEQQIPVPLSNITLDYKVLERPQKNDDTSTMKVLLVGAATNLLKKYENVISLTGLDIGAIETEVLAVIRATVTDTTFPTSLIVSIGTFNTSLTIVRHNIITFTYSIPTGGAAVSRAIASAFNFSMQQAEEYKKVYGLVDTDFGGKIAQAVEPILMTILSEIKKAFAYYRNIYKEEPIQQIMLSGATAKLPGLTAFFAKHAGIETLIVNPWKILSDQEVPKEIIDNAPEYTVAVGLAMRDNE